MNNPLFKPITTAVRLLARRTTAYLFPELCCVCDKPREEGSAWLCRSCLDSLLRNLRSRDPCPRCSQDRKLRACACHLAWDYPFERIVSVYDYDETVQAIMRLVKYGGMSHLAFEIGRLCLPGIPEDYFDGIDYLIAVPLHRMRLRQRGYNQAWWFAKGVIDRREMQGAVLLENVLVRRRNTRTQTKLDKEARKKNLEGAFEVMESGAGLVKDKAIVLVDDVITTGATMAACANELLKAGCKSVKVLSLARD